MAVEQEQSGRVQGMGHTPLAASGKFAGVLRRLKDTLPSRYRRRYSLGTYETLLSLGDWRPDDVIVDVGANDGRTIERWRRHLPQTRIYAFEPVASTFEALKAATAGQKDITLFNCALGAEAESRRIYIDERSALNSFYPDRISAKDTEVVQVEALDAVLARENIPHVRLLKIDAEGHDLEVLKGADRALREGRIDLVQVEAGFDVPGLPMPALHEFQAFLAPYAYHLNSITNQCRAKLSRYNGAAMGNAEPDPDVLVYCDAIFVAGRKPA